MKISLNWLKDYINLENIEIDSLIEKLTTSGLEIEEVIDEAASFNNIVVGLVKEKQKHPNADKLSICIVNDGERDYNVVCGAPNVSQGIKIAFAKIGAVVPNGEFKLKKVKIRGVSSEGMICSEKELGLGENHDGILILEDDAKIGMEFSDYISKKDIVLDIAITPNRADALSHMGVARDVASLFNENIIVPELKYNEDKKRTEDLAKVEIMDEIGCPRYIAKVLQSVTIKESPEWLKTKLISIGLRPVNNVVDVTNFVLHEVGQPLHAFDLDKLSGSKIIVRKAGESKKFKTLDEKERKLNENDLLICDAEEPVAIAGVMGGLNSEVTQDTVNILIEGAYFNPSYVRKTAKTLGLSTDASYRFERGADPDKTLWAVKRAAQLIAEFSDGKICAGEIDVYPNPIEKKKITLRFERLNKIMGFKIPDQKAIEILNSLNIKVISEEQNIITCLVPTSRPDIEREIDLIEEVARIYGYDKIPSVDRIKVTLDQKTDQMTFDQNLRDIFISLGFNEIITNSLQNENVVLNKEKALAILNPKSIDMAFTRTSLLPGMLLTISRNIKVKENNLKLFEIGKVFESDSSNNIKDFNDFEESNKLLLAVTGYATDQTWYSTPREFDLFDIAGFIEEFLMKMSLGRKLKPQIRKESTDLLEYSANYTFKKEPIIIGGKVAKKYLNLFEIKQDVFIFEIDIAKLKSLKVETKVFSELLKFPKIVKDMAFVLDGNMDSIKIINFVKSNSSKLLKNVKLFDIFQSDSLGKGKKSIALQLEYFAEDRTLTDDEVDNDFWNIIEKVKKEFEVELRG